METIRKIYQKRKKKQIREASSSVSNPCSLSKIKLATKDFSEEHFIAEGGFGKVYKGLIDNGQRAVAIKRRNPGSTQGDTEFLAEIKSLTELRHDNLVSLIGHCNEDGEMILVYEYMPLGTLANHIFKSETNRHNNSYLTWKQRLSICIEAGRGLDYLHSGRSIVHRDVKASNILLDENLTAKVSDFGLTKYLSRLESHVTTQVRGTFGYFDNYYFRTGRLTKSADTYAFGVVLLEVLSGRKSFDPSLPEDEHIITYWAGENIREGREDRIVASELRGEVSKDSLKTFVEIAEKCLREHPNERPKMALVVQKLELALEQQKNSESRGSNLITSDGEDIGPSNVKIKANLSPLLGQEQDIEVGFEDEVEKLMGYLTEDTQKLDVITIIGLPGQGKTTVARRIFNDPEIQNAFPIRIWVNVSQELKMKDVLCAILGEFTRPTEEIYGKSEQELAEMVAAEIEWVKFLIVMDDVRTIDDWSKFQIAFPYSSEQGKVLITSRHEEVALYANQNRPPHKLRILTLDESWLLLRLVVFGKARCPPELEIPGKEIAMLCAGLALAIVIIGGMFIKSSWREVLRNLRTCLGEDPLKRLKKIIEMCYDNLPMHLRACFLYFGMFPKHFEIPAWKLICMWVAEDFVPPDLVTSLEETPEFSREERAMGYLENLICRKLVRIDKMSSRGRVKTCHVPDVLRDFCQTATQDFLLEITAAHMPFEKLGDLFEPGHYRRFSIHSRLSEFLNSWNGSDDIYALVSSSSETIFVSSERVEWGVTNCINLEVLDVMPFKFVEFPEDLCDRLKYISLSISSGVLPATVSKLLKIETLIIHTTSRTLEIKADISKMIELRHLKTNASVTFCKIGKGSKENAELQTLGNISPESCTEEVFGGAPNLKKLGIRGRLALLLYGKTRSVDSLGKLAYLEKLKLLNDVFPNPPSQGKLYQLPPHMFPPNMRSLTLSNTFLDWSHMSTIALLKNLEELKLKNKAFMGQTWVVFHGFRYLEVLHIGRTNLAVWKALGRHFPSLKRLELMNCEELQEIPIEIANISTLELLDLYRSKLAVASAKKIRDKKQGEKGVSGFKLLISPDE